MYIDGCWASWVEGMRRESGYSPTLVPPHSRHSRLRALASTMTVMSLCPWLLSSASRLDNVGCGSLWSAIVNDQRGETSVVRRRRRLWSLSLSARALEMSAVESMRTAAKAADTSTQQKTTTMKGAASMVEVWLKLGACAVQPESASSLGPVFASLIVSVLRYTSSSRNT